MLTLTDEQTAFVEAIRDFARRECGTREQREALTDNGREPHNQELYERIADLGWVGVSIPEEYGGSGGGHVDMCLLCEEFARGQIPMGFFPITMMAARPVQRFATDELKQEILTGIVRGNVEAIAMSEPEAGSDVGNLSCRAERSNGNYLINGQKTWITAAHAADALTVNRVAARAILGKHDASFIMRARRDLNREHLPRRAARGTAGWPAIIARLRIFFRGAASECQYQETGPGRDDPLHACAFL